ncbi:nucleotide-binding universal stress UspA family protein [Bradyrhizobium elkanii]|uniref:universal stress protein n=1 Tax=Bradyrhizobium elkanii TaxID=29448 RepID=UPI000841C4C7|nr:universal stress protein [Bradyrhizobium elkanii]ODM84174.1 universal stress protein UspA [Bradyrhizobium elkanii]ODM86121.1 universal stress protein UspA [Bradyrhizobium elkanii]
MFRNMLVLIPSERPVRPVVDGSISLADACSAHIAALAIGYEPANIPIAAVVSPATPTIFEEERLRAMERAETAINVFENEVRKTGLAYTCRTMSAIPAEAVAFASAAARLHDLTIVSQPDFERSTFDNDLSTEILFQSGGPVLFMPHTFRGPLSPRRIGICWDGSRLASRALRDAMPLLKNAEAITIATIDDSETIPDEASPERLVQHLARAPLSAKIVKVCAQHSEIQPALLSVAADQRLDLLVMGGYGHSRFQERFLGGVTREMLQSMPLPTLMSH